MKDLKIENLPRERTQAEIDAFEEASIDAQMSEREPEPPLPVCTCKKPRYGNDCCLICYGTPRRMGP